MNPYPQRLEPANEQQHTVLPENSQSVSTEAGTYHSLLKTYQNGISFIDPIGSIQGAMTGHLTYICGFGVIGSVFMCVATASSGIDFMTVLLAMVALICLMVVRSDMVAHRYQPILFDREAQQIHVFVDEGVRLSEPFRLTPRSSIRTWDWENARAEIIEFVALGDGNVPQTRYALHCAITDRPGGKIVVERFGVGIPSDFEPGPMLRQWEHIRRFMVEGGPHSQPADNMFDDGGVPGLWAGITLWQPLLGPGSRVYWTGELHRGMWYLTVPGGMLFLMFLPFTMAAGLMRWAAMHARREPVWPEKIVASIGREFSIGTGAEAMRLQQKSVII